MLYPRNQESPSHTSTPKDTLNARDYVKLLKGEYQGLYAVVIGRDTEDPRYYLINYYKKGPKYWTFVDGDIDKVLSANLKHVTNYKMDLRGHIYFNA